MARIRSVDFLPEIFKTDVNREFLGATLDQLIQQPKLKRTQGYVGRRFGPGTNFNDGYVLEPSLQRANYQFEPAVVFKDNDGNVTDAMTYVGMLDALDVKGANTSRADRLFASQTYSWDPNIDFDKFINYSQYYWIPAGPDAVDVNVGSAALIDDFDVSATEENYYGISGLVGDNPTITLVRGGAYTFNVNQPGNPFWIQSEPGTDGTLDFSPNLSSRDVLGVVNNGDDVGTVTFNVPKSTDQNFYYGLNNIGTIDLATMARFDSIHNRLVSLVDNIDGITDLEGKTLVFLNPQQGDPEDLGWVDYTPYDSSRFDQGDPYPEIVFEPTRYITDQDERYGLYRITYVDLNGSTFIKLIKISDIDVNDKFKIGSGAEYSNTQYYKNASGFFEKIPQLTALDNILYYQDGVNPLRFGVIQLVDPESDAVINVDAILGRQTYTSPNGVVFTNGLKIRFASVTEPSFYQNNEYIIEGVGHSIELIPVADLVTPETYVNTDSELFDLSPFDTLGFDGSFNAPLNPDYLTIKRNSADSNAWSRYNRWFHRDVILATAEYNNSVANFDSDLQAKRPIIEFNAGLRLFNYGTQAKQPVDIIDLTQVDALSNVNGSTGYFVDGYQLINGTRIIFAADQDASVRNRIYTVQIVDPDDLSTEYGNIINLVPADDTQVVTDETVLCLSGNTLQGKMFRYTGAVWIEAQQKTQTNQAPLFDVFDSDGYSFGDTSVYPSNTFTGSKLFSYKQGSGRNDPVLGFPLTYLNIDNLGDIVFENNQYSDTFVYANNSTRTQRQVSDGFVRKYSSRTEYENKIGWTTSVDRNWQRQVFTFEYQGKPLLLDVAPRTDITVPGIKVYANNQFIDPDNYIITVNSPATVTFKPNTITAGTMVQVKIISDEASGIGYYEIPNSLESNPFNENANTITLGTVRNHFNRLAENIVAFDGIINGANNLRDLGDITGYGDTIVQHSAPVTPAAFFLRKEKYDFFGALQYVGTQYEKTKYLILDWVNNNDTYGMTHGEILDAALTEINAGKSNDSTFFWSDMIPAGGNYVETIHEITAITTGTFNTNNVYDFTSANQQGLLVYLNDTLLLKDYDYTVATDGPRITILTQTQTGDLLKVREYSSTLGNFIPETPTKMGLYPKYEPKIYVDNTYVEDQTVIQGHDGSIYIGFNDVRDSVLLEFEKRIYNNLKVNSDTPIVLSDVLPGKFRNTDYTDSEITEILSAELLNWVGWHKIDYKTQNYLSTNEWTWNYSRAGSTLDNTPLKGNWRGIYKNYYDTDRPHTNPWEMLGFSEMPDWWEAEYGPAPYTSGNQILWDDLEAGYIRGTNTYDSRYARAGLSAIIPVDSEGQLKNPFEFLVSNYNQSDFKKSWIAGDIGPAENAWRRSSSWPFAVQKLLALTKPAEYFALGIDRDLYTYSNTLDQYAYARRYRLDVKTIDVYNDTTPKHSYIDWIAEYNRSTGVPDTDGLNTEISELDVRLAYRMGAFTDKKYLKIFTDKSSPDSSNTSLLIPDESYDLLLYKNQSFADIQFSSVMIQRTDNGYAVYGNSQTEAYFRILESSTSGDFETITVGSTRIRIPTKFTSRVVRVPYGYTFTSINSVVDFLVSYGAFLEAAGMTFDDVENNIILSWAQMAQEFVYWADQNWVTGSLININPSASVLKHQRPLSVIDNLNNLAINERPLDQNRQPLKSDDFSIVRLDNQFKLVMLADKSLSYLRLRSTSYEHLLIMDNVSIFNDLMYQPVTGLRQQRIKIDGFTTFEWNGQLDAQGFIINQDNVSDWNANLNYNKGDIVKYKNSYWSASEKLQPTETFEYDDWIKIDYDLINKGMIPNISSKADQMTKYYDNATANLESDVDLLAFGITGFRPRDYLESLNIGDLSQINIYSDLVNHKGTPSSVKLFQGVTFDKDLAEYNIYENWAIKRATYGANDNKRFVEFSLDGQLIESNPSIIEVNTLGVDTVADQLIQIDNIYKQSNKNTTTNIFPELTEVITDVALPSAGYVNSDDIDVSIFNLDDLTSLTEQLDKVRDGAYVWVAKSNKYDWNVYRCSLLRSQPVFVYPDELTTTTIDYRVRQDNPKLVSVIDNLNGTLTLEFDLTVDLHKDELIIVKYFNDTINGAHQILSIEGTKSVTVSGSLTGSTTVATGNGIVFKLTAARVDQASDIANTEYNSNLIQGDKVWVDADINGKWKVYEKTVPFRLVQSTTAPGTTDSYNFGISLAQAFDGYGAIIGATEYTNRENASGGVYCYNKDANTYVFDSVLTLDPNKAQGYGNAVAISKNWGVAGASLSISGQGLATVIYRNPSQDIFQNWQYLTLPVSDQGNQSQEFGAAVAISEDENWIYVSAPGIASVYAYEKIVYQTQTATFTADGQTTQYDLSADLKINAAEQLTVSFNNVVQNSTGYYLSGTTLIFYGAPASGTEISVTRKNTTTKTGDGSTLAFSITELYTATSIDSFSVDIGGVLLRPYYDYTFNNSTQEITFTVAPSSGSTISIRAQDYYRYVGKISGSSNEDFGRSIKTTSDGQQIVIGAPEATNTVDGGTQNFAGKTYVYERIVERFVVTNKTTSRYTTRRSIDAPNAVRINGVKQINSINNVDSNYSIDTGSNSVTIDANPVLNTGDLIDIDINQFQLVQTLTAERSNQGAYFGSALGICRSDCSVYVSAPKDNTLLPEAGSVARFVNRSRAFGYIDSIVTNPSVTAGETIRIDNIDVQFTGTSLNQVVSDINSAVVPNVQASIVDNKLRISIINTNESPLLSKMTVMPGQGTAFETLGLQPYELTQTIVSPRPEEYSEFGSSIHVDYSATNLVVGAKKSSAFIPTVFDSSVTTFDSNTTKLSDVVPDSGAVFTFDLLSSSAYNTPGKFVFGQQIFSPDVRELDGFGTAVDFTDGLLLVTSPGYDTTLDNIGRLTVFGSSTGSAAWQPIQEQPTKVDYRLIDAVYIYDATTQAVKTYLDFIDPVNGKILGAAQQNIDIIGAVDPASYSVNNNGTYWAANHTGTIWWDTTNARFVNYNQQDLVYSSKNWGTLADGSSVDVYEWIESSVPPAQYTGAGTVKDIDQYTVISGLDQTRTITTRYYFWVKDYTTVNRKLGKTLSATAIASYIQNPQSSGIPYAAMMRKNVVALYNVNEYVDESNSILHIEYNQNFNENKVFVEYDLIREQRPKDFLSDSIYRKLQDSFCGTDTLGSKVPDINLSPDDRYGVEFRPRRSLFVDRLAALKIYITNANLLLAQQPYAELTAFNILNSKDPIPSSSSGAYDDRVADLSELSYQNLQLVSPGYKLLVESDSSNNGLWTIYQVQPDLSLMLIRVQNYNTPNYWDYADWYADGYNTLSKPSRIVDTYSELLALTVPNDTLVKVNVNSTGNWELYNYNSLTGWTRVGTQNGTIQLSDALWDYTNTGFYGFDVEIFDAQYFDQEPVTETRQIIKAINEELFVGNSVAQRNQLLVMMFNYILSEQGSIDWLFKTSLIDVEHKVRNLEKYNVYRRDNQTFVQKYIEESKPYHVKIKDFLLKYEGIDLYDGSATDFDNPAAYDSVYERYISPILDDGFAVLETDPSNRLSTDAVWNTIPWSDWYNNHLLTVDEISITNAGSGYTVPPTVNVIGDATQPAQAVALINSVGQITEIQITTPGYGYRTTPIVEITGGNGTGARATVYMKNDLVRNIKTTIKYDRYEYQSQIVDWTPDTVYNEDQLVRYNDRVYRASLADGSSIQESTFDPENYELVDASTLSGVDRTTGFYVADVNNPGLDLALLIDGIDYPGVQVQSTSFSDNTGYDIGNFDITPFDNIDYGPEGLPTYSDAILDAEYSSLFTDIYIGTRAEDINVDGGAFIDEYSSHAPEELVPGAIFDTLDMTVRTRPGHDYTGNGHASQIKGITYVYDGGNTFSFAGVVEHPVELVVFNGTTGNRLYNTRNYTIDWVNRTITITSGASSGQTVKIYVYEIGGAHQIFRKNYIGNKIGNRITVPVDINDINQALILVNGVETTAYNYAETVVGETEFTFSTSYTGNDFIVMTLFGEPILELDSTLIDYGYSYPETEIFVSDGTTNSFIISGNIESSARDNIIVELNGRRLRPSEGVRHIGDGTTVEFYFPDGIRTGTDQTLIADSEVVVYVNNVKKTLGNDYAVSLNDESSERYVIMSVTPDAGDTVDVYVTGSADYTVNNINNELKIVSSGIVLSSGDVIAVTTFRDIRQQDALTVVYQGPKVIELPVSEGLDIFGFDNVPFDFTIGVDSTVNIFELYRTIENADRIWVTLNGRRLVAGEDFVLSTDGTAILLSGGAISAIDVVAITTFTDSVVPDELSFRIFNDMRGNAAVYRIIPDNTTELAQILEPWHDTVYVDDASKLGEPNLPAGIFGVVNINGERITYRTRDTVNNTISGLRRGTAGTAIQRHAASSAVQDQSRGSVLNHPYNSIWYKVDTTIQVGEFDSEPYDSDSWDETSVTNGIALQKQQTTPARFLRGE